MKKIDKSIFLELFVYMFVVFILLILKHFFGLHLMATVSVYLLWILILIEYNLRRFKNNKEYITLNTCLISIIAGYFTSLFPFEPHSFREYLLLWVKSLIYTTAIYTFVGFVVSSCMLKVLTWSKNVQR